MMRLRQHFSISWICCLIISTIIGGIESSPAYKENLEMNSRSPMAQSRDFVDDHYVDDPKEITPIYTNSYSKDPRYVNDPLEVVANTGIYVQHDGKKIKLTSREVPSVDNEAKAATPPEKPVANKKNKKEPKEDPKHQFLHFG